jgi:hypothetical protein
MSWLKIERRDAGVRMTNASGSVDVMGRSVDECLNAAMGGSDVGDFLIQNTFDAAEVLDSLMGPKS